jgi:O-succinylbenzoate synthase
MEPVHVWRYVLRSRSKLNAVSARREFEGALIRVGNGFGCIHPWPELGDPGLGELLEELAEDRPVHRLAREAMTMAALDGEWRQRGRSMLEEVMPRIPESHATLPECSLESVQEAVHRGFSVIKVKGHRDIAELAGQMDSIARRWPHLRWRIDFNGVLSAGETLEFVQCLTDQAWTHVDFIEDPCTWDEEAWRSIREAGKVRLAVDRGSWMNERKSDVLVFKPGRLDWQPAGGETSVVVTSNMDHPLGQCYAAWRAGRLVQEGFRVDVCGLQTHELFEADEFSERLGPARPRFSSPGGTGLGFDDLLEKLPWKLLK